MEKASQHLIGLTGGIGAGKSVVARILRTMGYLVYDCDSEAKKIMQSSQEIISSLKEWFGEECYDGSGNLNKAHLSFHLFSSGKAQNRERVNKLVHRVVRQDVIAKSEEQWRGGEPFFVESAILHTSHLDRLCSRIWLVEAPEELRIRRAIERGGIPEVDILKRMEAQRSEFSLLPLDKVDIIGNSGEESLIIQIKELIIKI